MAMRSSTVASAAVALMVSCMTVAVTGMSDHVPEAACQSMIPLGHEVDAQLSQPPYVLKVPAGPIPADSEVNVVVTGVDPTMMFKGFFVKAFDDATGTPTGMFTKAPKTIDCDGPASGAHHADPMLKESVVLAWRPPLGFVGSVTFMATVVMEKAVFWTGVVSNQVTFA